MAFGEITKQLGNVKDVLDVLRSPDLSSISETIKTNKPPQGAAESAGATMLAQLHAMQRALKPEEELFILFNTGIEAIRVLEIYAPSWQVMVLTGVDSEKNITRVISHADNLQLTCKVLRAEKPIRIGLITPKPKSD